MVLTCCSMPRAPQLKLIKLAPFQQQARVSRGTKAVSARCPLVCRSASANPTGADDKLVPAQTLVGDDLEQWKACVALVEGVGFEADKAEEILTRAFGWGSQAYWRKSKVNKVPSPAQVEESLNFIQELMENKESDVVKVVSGFPESLAIGVEDGPPGLKYASNFIEDSWKMKGKAKTMMIARKPAVLGCQIDCRGDCAGTLPYRPTCLSCTACLALMLTQV